VTSDIHSNLTRLPEPEPPAPFCRTVMARVARVAEGRRPVDPVLPPTTMVSRETFVRRWSPLAARVAAAAGVAIVCVSWTYGILADGGWLGLVPSRPWLPAPTEMPAAVPATVGLALGLLLYLAGLFAPLRGGERPHTR
jgi:hypothetical protein